MYLWSVNRSFNCRVSTALTYVVSRMISSSSEIPDRTVLLQICGVGWGGGEFV